MEITSYDKPYLTVDEQIGLLADRGLDVESHPAAAATLRRVGYYRLSGYWYPYRRHSPDSQKRLDEFQPGTTFDQVVQLYEFDRRLRLLVMDAIERVEVATRFHVGHVLGRRGSFAHTDPRALDQDFGHHNQAENAIDIPRWLPTKHRAWLERRSAEECRSNAEFVDHFKKKYGLPLPVWVVTEIFDFGGLSTLYAGLLQIDRDEIAANFNMMDRSGAGNSSALQSCLRNLNLVRNVCAHHGRLWNTNIVERVGRRSMQHIPDLAHINHDRQTTRIYASLAVLGFLTRHITPSDDWVRRCRALIHELPAGRSESEMGFPPGWRSETVWQQ